MCKPDKRETQHPDELMMSEMGSQVHRDFCIAERRFSGRIPCIWMIYQIIVVIKE